MEQATSVLNELDRGDEGPWICIRLFEKLGNLLNIMDLHLPCCTVYCFCDVL